MKHENKKILWPGKAKCSGLNIALSQQPSPQVTGGSHNDPDTLGLTCVGLCVSCQRMYEFQPGGLDFYHERTVKYEEWGKKLQVTMNYFEDDKQLRDILIIGGDALVSRYVAIVQMFTAILEMAERKIRANNDRPDGEKYAEISRTRPDTLLPAYLP